MCKCEKKMVQIMKLNTCRETLNLHENGARLGKKISYEVLEHVLFICMLK